MNKYVKNFKTEVSRRQVMIGAAGFSFAFALSRDAGAAVRSGGRARHRR